MTAQNETRDVPLPRPLGPDHTTLKVLVVDDTKALREHVATLLRAECRATVVEAENGVQALKKLREHVFALIVTDVNMPLLDGIKLIHLVRQDHLHREIPILVMTTEAAQEDRSRALAVGASAFMAKPTEDQALVRRVWALLDAAARP